MVMDAIGTTRTCAHATVTQLVAAVLRQRRLAGAPCPAEPPDRTRVVKAAEAVVAYVNHGRWVADCPDPACAGAELVDPAEPLFYCLSCYNAAVGGAWRPVRFPPRSARQAIEQALLERARPERRNWYPGETVEDLRREHALRQHAEAERLARVAGLRRVVERHGPVTVERWVPIERETE